MTPIQELIEQLKEERDLHGYEKQGYFQTAIELAEGMLEKEKEVIINAVKYGFLGMDKIRSAEEYYNETFKTKEK